MTRFWWRLFMLGALITANSGRGEEKPRARDLGIPFDGTPGPLNAITDVPGVEVGHSTIIEGEGKLIPGQGPVRTGVTAILPRGRAVLADPVFASTFALNGNGELTGTAWIEESGFLESAILMTNTHSVGTVRDSTIAWRIKSGPPDASGYWWSLPTVGETWDGDLNDINGFHVKEKHVFEALDTAKGGAVAEGNVGGGTGMICFDFKGGIGTASRRLKPEEGGYTVGVLVQCNCGDRDELRIAGVPVGRELPGPQIRAADSGSILIFVGTNAPLLPHQLKRLAHRATMGLARVGSYSGNGSGDLFLAFSTANSMAASINGPVSIRMLPNDAIDPLFLATIQATEEAIVNALVAAETMTGGSGLTVEAIPHAPLQEVLKKHGVIQP